MLEEKQKESPMFVAIIILGVVALGPAALRLAVAAIATLLAARSWEVQRRYADALAAADQRDRHEVFACRTASRDDRRLLAASLRNMMQITCLTSLLPDASARGARLARRFRR